MADNFDEFEFKPLTEGLGFHKKAQKTNPISNYDFKEPIKQSKTTVAATISTEDLGKLGQPTEIAKPKTNPFLNSPIPREGSQVPKFGAKKFAMGHSPEITPQKPPTTILRKEPEIRRQGLETKIESQIKLDDIIRAKKPFDFDSIQFLETNAHIGSYLFDLIVTIGLAALFSMSLMLVSDIDVFKIFSTISFDIGMQLGAGLLIISVLQLYTVLSRSFYGCTLGEWVFDIQLGKPQDQQKVTYPIRTFWRGLVIALTGIITLPLISLITGKDIPARLGGLQLYKK